MNSDFFDRLYSGFKSEYFIMGELFGAGFEGFKLPGDFGFDILATNQKEISFNHSSNGRNLNPPYVLQIKSKKIVRDQFKNDGPNKRPQAFVDFWLSKNNFGIIQSEKSGYLICVISIVGSDHEISRRNIYFWLHSEHLTYLLDKKYFTIQQPPFESNQSYYRIKVCIRLFPKVETKNLIENLFSSGHLNEEGKKNLIESLPDFLPAKWKASEYLGLTRQYKNDNNLEAVRILPEELLSVENLGKSISISLLD